MQLLNAIDSYIFLAKAKIKGALTNERGEVNIVTIVVLIGIAVILAVAFKNQIGGLLTTLFGALSTNATNAIDGK